jgi:predicted ATP-grasp superfamily ATP-dependent carboligase
MITELRKQHSRGTVGFRLPAFAGNQFTRTGKIRVNASPKILVLGNYRQTITVIRSLAKTGHAVIVGRSGPAAFTEFSRWTSEVWVHDSMIEQEASFIDQLAAFLNERRDVPFIFPVDENEIACFERNSDRLSGLATIIMPDKNLFFSCIDKERMYKLCFSLGIPIPATSKVRSLTELHQNAGAVGYPVIVKPNDGYKYFFDNKAIVCRNQNDLAAFLPSWPIGHEYVLLQKYTEGYRHNCHFFAVRGDLRAYFENKTLRTDRLNGTGLGVDNTIVRPTALLQEYCARLIASLGFTGVGCVQFIVNGDEARFLEINPRLDANCAIPYRCGYDFPCMAFDLARGLEAGSPQPAANCKNGTRAYWLMGDIYGLDNELHRGNVNARELVLWIAKLLNSLIRSDFHVTWSWRDPAPALFLLYSLFAGIVRRFGRTVKRVFTGARVER